MSSRTNSFAYINGDILPLEKAFIHVSDLAVQRGYGVFEFFRVQNGFPLFLDHYLNRFYGSALLMRLSVPLSQEALKSVIYTLIQRNNLPVSGIKIILTGGYSANGYDLGTPNLIITQQTIALPTPDQVQKGYKIITHEYVREIPPAKTINYSIGIRLLHQIKANNADDVLYHQGGSVTEFPRCNFFIVKQDNRVVTPAQDVLLGITRKNVLDLAGKKYKTQEAEITLDDILQAKEAFLTSTTKRIMPIVQVNDTRINNGKPGAITLELLEDLIAFEKNSFSLQN